MVRNNKKSDATNDPLAELKQLQSELDSLREKHVATLEKELQVIEKKAETEKTKVDKSRQAATEAERKLAAIPTGNANQHRRAETVLQRARKEFEQHQGELAQLRSESIELKLQIRREKAVIKAMQDTEKALKRSPAAKVSAPAKKSAPKKAAAPKASKTAAPAKPKVAAKSQKAAQQPAAAAKPEAAAKPSPATATSAKQKAGAKSKAKAEPAGQQPPLPPAVRRQRVKHRMSDIPSHPDKMEDRLASLFEDF